MTLSNLAQAQCDCCGGWFPRGELLRQLRAWPENIGQNLVPFSSYSSLTGGWTSTAVDDGFTGWGQQAMASRMSIDDDGTTTTETDGAQTWSGDGTITQAGSIDVSAITTVRMSVSFGPHHADCGLNYTVTIGLKNGASDYPMAVVVAKSQRTIKGDLAVAGIAPGEATAMVAYIDVDAPSSAGRWSVERIQVWDQSTHGDDHVATSGAAATSTGDTAMAARVVCASCKDPRLDRIEDYEHDKYEPLEIAEDLELD